MSDITIVTAFFDIGRENYTEIPRSKQKYFEYFKRWARIKNDLVFVCENQLFADEVLQIRDEFGLKDKTKIIKIDDVEKVEPEILASLQQIETNEEFLNFRASRTCTENIGKYNYVMLMKYYSLYLVSKEKYAKNTLVWLDFGFEHGGEAFKNEDSYNFEWEYDFGKLANFYYLEPMETRPIFDVCRTIHPDCIMGCMLTTPKALAEELYKEIKQCYIDFANVGLMDDDQLYLLWAARRRPDLIKTTPSNWFMPIKEFSNGTFEVKPKEVQKFTFMQRVKNKIKRIWKKINGKSGQ